MVKVSSSAGSAHFKSHVVVDDPVAEASVSGTSNGAEQHPDVEVLDALHKHATVKPKVTFTKGAQSSNSVLKEDCVETVDLSTSIADVDNAKNDGFAPQKCSLDGDSAVKTVAKLGQITKVTYQLYAVILALLDNSKKHLFRFTGTTTLVAYA